MECIRIVLTALATHIYYWYFYPSAWNPLFREKYVRHIVEVTFTYVVSYLVMNII